MPYLIGGALALAVGFMALLAGFDRDRSFYPTILAVVASYYVLFAAMGGTTMTVAAETLGLAVFLVAAKLGQRISAWITAFALAGHGVLDAFHGQLLNNPGVPAWWPAFCGAYDVAAALFLVTLLIARASTVGRSSTARYELPDAVLLASTKSGQPTPNDHASAAEGL